MKNYFKPLFLPLALLFGLSLSAQTEFKFNNNQNGFSVVSRNSTTTTILHHVNAITLEDSDREELTGQYLTLSGIHLANTAGAPDLPSSSAFVAIPNGAKPSLRLVSAQTKLIKDVDLIPAPLPQLDNDDSPAVYEKDKSIYDKNAFYPETPYQISEVTSVRGVEMVQVGVMPFQYNPVTKELLVYESLELELTTEGGDGTYGDLRYRTPEWDHILTDMLLNREVLPEIDYGEKLRRHYENRETGCEYLIITPDNDDFLRLADSIKQFRTQQGIPTEVYTVTECGGNDDHSIKNFLRNAYYQWDMPPAAVLILGDHSSNPAQGVVSYTMNNHPGGSGYNPYISDHAYSDMTGNNQSDLIVGRITGRDFDELYRMIKKDLDYERRPPTNPDFYDHPITAMGFQLERWFQLCSEVVHGFWEHELGKHPVRMNAIYQGTPGSRWSTYEYTNTALNYFGPDGCGYVPRTMSHLTDWSANANKVNEAINSGAFIIQNRDHGAEELWGEPGYSIGSIKRLINPDLTYVMSNNCLTGKFNYNGSDGCFAEAFHRHQYGALGLIAATEVSYSFVNDVYVWGMYDNLWPDFMPTYGTVHPTNFLLPAFGNAAGKYFLKQSSWTDESVKEITYYLFHQHGDVFMNLYSEVPQPLDVEMLPVLVAGSETYPLKVDEDATICLTANGQIIGFGYGTGHAQLLDITPQEVGTRVTLTITKQNHYRYEHQLATIPAEGPYLIFNELKINDEEGNHNHEADYDETCVFGLGLHNVGFADIGNLQVSLSCPNPQVQVVQNQASFGNIEPNGTLMNENAFAVRFGDHLDDGQPLRFYIDITNGTYSFRDSVEVKVNAPVLQYTHVGLADLDGTPVDRLMRGTPSLLTFDLSNQGHSLSKAVLHRLNLKAPFLKVDEQELASEPIEAGATAQVTFKVEVDDEAPTGGILQYELRAESDYYSIDHPGELPLGYTMEDFEGETLNPNFSWNVGTGNRKWQVVEDTTAPGGHCMRSPTMSNNKISTLYIGIQANIDDKLLFHHKTSTDEGDQLILYLDQEEVASWSGESDWEQSEFPIKAGTNLIRFCFKKDASGSAGDDCVMIDNLCLPPLAELVFFAGDDVVICPDTVFAPNSYAYNQSAILWTTEGDGVFDDETAEQPIYTLGYQDRENGGVNLTMTATSALNETEQSQLVRIDLIEDLTEWTPIAPIGDTLVDLLLITESEFQAEDTLHTVVWTLEPEEAGLLSHEGSIAKVEWTENYKGTASLTYQLLNECGETEPSEPLRIHIVNSTGIQEQTEPMMAIFPNPAQGHVNLRMEGLAEGHAMLRVIAADGRVMESREVKTNGSLLELHLTTDTYPQGVYTLQVIDAERARFGHFVIR